MSHELRTPLNSILGFSESLLEQNLGALNPKQEQYINLMHSSGQHLLGLINDILEVSKIEAGKLELRPEIVSVNQICNSSLNFIKELANKKSISVEFKNEHSTLAMRADRQRLKQILVNLLNNAVKFTPQGGKIILEVQTNPEIEQIQFSVQDNGIGIAHENLSKLFTPFTQLDSSLSREHEGTGLGLMLVLRLTELHGGSITVESQPAQGSRFTINLPWSEIELMEREQDTATLPVKTDIALKDQSINQSINQSILLVEDNEANIVTIEEYLSNHGYQITVARDGLEAITKAEKMSPSLILMDIQIPKVDGLEAIRRLRANPQFVSVPIIALTALAMPGDREKCMEAGASKYMSKPVSLKELRNVIENFLNK